MLTTNIKKTLVILGNASLILSMIAGLMGCSTASATSSAVETEKDTKAPVITLKSDTYKIELGSKYDLNENVKSVIPVALIFLSCLLTACGIYDKIAAVCKAGTLVPITGFANAVCSPAIDAKSEGFVLGVGAKMFTIAGPVIVYGSVVSVIWGIVYFFMNK